MTNKSNMVFKCICIFFIVVIWLLSLTHIAFNFESMLNLGTTLDIITLTCILVLFLIHTLTPLFSWVFNPFIVRLRKYPSNQDQIEIYNESVKKYCDLEKELENNKVKFKFSETNVFEIDRDEIKSNATVVYGNNATTKSMYLLYSFLVSLFLLICYFFFCGLLNSNFTDSIYTYFFFFSLLCFVGSLYKGIKLYEKLKRVAPKEAEWFIKLVNALPEEDIVEIYNTKGINLNKIRVEKISLTSKEVE